MGRDENQKNQQSRQDWQVTYKENLRKLLELNGREPENARAALALADHYARTGQPDKITDLLTPIASQYPFAEESSRRLYNSCLMIGLASAGRGPEAEEVIERSLKDDGPSLASSFVTAFLAISMREFDRAEKAALAYLERAKQFPEAQLPASLVGSRPHRSQLINFLGIAQAEQKRPDEAMDSYRRAIESDPGNHLPMLNLVSLLIACGRADEAAPVVRSGLRTARQVDELRMLSQNLGERASISACMIVKDEEELLPDCLESIRDWVDEIVVVDTGSTDRTVEIAKDYGATVFHQEWEGDFSKHRNYSIEQATGDWVFIIDADERFCTEDLTCLNGAIRDSKCKVLSVNLFNEYAQECGRVTYANSVRLFKRELNLRYEGIVHNELRVPDDLAILRTKARMRHLGYGLSPEKMRQKFERTRDLLEKQLDGNPDNTFALFNYGELLRGVDPQMSRENANEVIRTASRVVDLVGANDPVRRHLYLMSLMQLASAHLSQSDHQLAREACEQALACRPDYLDAWMYLGHAFHGLQNYDQARDALEKYLEYQDSFDGSNEEAPIILSFPASRDIACNNLGILHEMKGDLAKAQQYYEQALEANPRYRETNSLLGRLFLRTGETDRARLCFENQLDTGRPTHEALLGLAQISRSRGEFDRASELLVQAGVEFPDDPEVHLEMGRCCLAQDRIEQAHQNFVRGFGHATDPDRTATALAEECFQNGRFHAAINLYKWVLETGKKTSGRLNDLANCYYRLGDYEQAEIAFGKATRCEPVLPVSYRSLGLTRARLGRSDIAIEALSQYLELDPDDNDVRLLLAQQLLQSGRLADSIGHFEQVLRLQSENRSALLGISEAYLVMGHKDSAITGFKRLLKLDPDCEPARKRLEKLETTVSRV